MRHVMAGAWERGRASRRLPLASGEGQPEAGVPAEFGISPVEETILESFRELLGRRDLGLDDEFFASGGDSLLAIELTLELEQLLGQAPPIAMLGHGGTARTLAAMLEDAPVALPDPFVTLQPKGHEAPLFCLHDLYGRALSHVSLARRLGPHMPVHGLLPGAVRDELIARPRMATLIGAHLATIRALQPRGPYRISGFSFCGPFAHELACALEAEGETVVLVLIDSPILTRRPGALFIARWLARELRQAPGPRGTWRAIRASRSIWLRWFMPRLPIWNGEIPGFVPRCDRVIARAIMQARIGWRPRPFGGRTLMMRSGATTPTVRFMDRDGLLGWGSALTGPVTTIEIAGSHNDMMREPLVAGIAAAIRGEAAAR